MNRAEREPATTAPAKESHNGRAKAQRTTPLLAGTWSKRVPGRRSRCSQRLRAQPALNWDHLSPHIRAHVLCAPPRARYVFLSPEVSETELTLFLTLVLNVKNGCFFPHFFRFGSKVKTWTWTERIVQKNVQKLILTKLDLSESVPK